MIKGRWCVGAVREVLTSSAAMSAVSHRLIVALAVVSALSCVKSAAVAHA